MAVFIDKDGNEVEVLDAVDIREWKSAGFKEKGKRGAGKQPKTAPKEEVKPDTKETPKSSLIEEDA